MAMSVPYSIEDLASQLTSGTYTPRTDEELNTAAQNRYASVYNQKRNVANQNYQTKDLAYENQLAQLQNQLIDSQNTVAKNTADSLAAANRNLVARGMQRSSFGAANAARIQTAGQQNLANLLRDFNVNSNNIQSNRTLLAQQLADTLASYDTDMQTDILAYIDEQQQLDYERSVQAQQYANQLAFDLYSAQQASKSGGGGGSRRSYGYTPSASGNGNNSLVGSIFDAVKGYTKAPSFFDEIDKQVKAYEAKKVTVSPTSVPSKKATVTVSPTSVPSNKTKK